MEALKLQRKLDEVWEVYCKALRLADAEEALQEPEKTYAWYEYTGEFIFYLLVLGAVGFVICYPQIVLKQIIERQPRTMGSYQPWDQPWEPFWSLKPESVALAVSKTKFIKGYELIVTKQGKDYQVLFRDPGDKQLKDVYEMMEEVYKASKIMETSDFFSDFPFLETIILFC